MCYYNPLILYQYVFWYDDKLFKSKNNLKSIELQIFNCQAEHTRVRKECIEYMKKNKDRFEAVN